jgi:uncharacterized protein
MLLVDVNVLVYAGRADAVDHDRYADWLNDLVSGDQAFGMSDLVFSAFLRIVTNPRIFKNPSTMAEALAFVEAVRRCPQCVSMSPGPRHWRIFADLCRNAGVRGSLVSDTYFAALAIESGSEWITTDRDYARFPGLRWRHPLAST